MFQLRLLLACLLTLLGSLVFGTPSWGHAMGENYVRVNVGESRLEGHFEIHARDLEQKLGIDVKAAGTASEQLVADTAAKVQQYIREHFRIQRPTRADLGNGLPFARSGPVRIRPDRHRSWRCSIPTGSDVHDAAAEPAD